MSWIGKVLRSSLGRKLVMSLTGLFLILFLLTHLAGNLQLLIPDKGEAFNRYADFMRHFLPIQIIAWGFYLLYLIHIFQGFALWAYNRKARGNERYAVKATRAVNTNAVFASNMAFLGLLIFAFLGIHMGDFWWASKFGDLPVISYGNGHEYHDLYKKVVMSFSQLWIVVVYVISMIALAFHLWHGFQSAFQTLGLNHKKYMPFIRGFGKLYAIIIPLLFALIPIIMYLQNAA